MLSESVYDQIKNRSDVDVVRLGRFRLKNLGRPFEHLVWGLQPSHPGPAHWRQTGGESHAVGGGIRRRRWWEGECLSSQDSGRMCRSIVDTDDGGLRWSWRGTWWRRSSWKGGAAGKSAGRTGSPRAGSPSWWAGTGKEATRPSGRDRGHRTGSPIAHPMSSKTRSSRFARSSP